jgi:NAD(P)-dependent dehydrogenase (short-subunit alcohol dehydrogenase family)
MDQLSGRVAVVTGAASGIGLAMAERFGAEGMRLVLADVEAGPLEAVASRLRATGLDVEALRVDVSDPDQVQALADAAMARFGAVHVVCNNAGVVTMGPVWEQPLDDWRWVLGVNLWGVVHGVRAFLPILLEQGEPAHIVNTASIAGLVPSPGIGPYNVSKSGVVALSESLRLDLEARDAPIGVSVVCPGAVPTRIAESGRNRPGGAGAPLDIPTQADPPPSALRPEQIADRVVEAITSDRFWVVTHERSMGLVRDRTDRIARGEAPAAPPVF